MGTVGGGFLQMETQELHKSVPPQRLSFCHLTRSTGDKEQQSWPGSCCTQKSQMLMFCTGPCLQWVSRTPTSNYSVDQSGTSSTLLPLVISDMSVKLAYSHVLEDLNLLRAFGSRVVLSLQFLQTNRKP